MSAAALSFVLQILQQLDQSEQWNKVENTP